MRGRGAGWLFMRAARAPSLASGCATRAHRVVLMEAGSEVGGQLLLATRATRRRDLIGLVRWRGGLAHGQVGRSNCTILRVTASAEAPVPSRVQ